MEDLQLLGVRRGGALLVHSSLRSLGPVMEGPEAVVQALLESVGPGGTLLMPALSYLHVRPTQTDFHQLQTPSNVGLLAETFRGMPGTRRSVHPTHSACAAGPLAVPLLEHHHLDQTPCGPRSPFRLLADAGGQILFLGCGLRPNTSMHGVEELVEPPYLFAGATSYRCTLADGTVRPVFCRNHGFEGYEQRYDRLAGLLSGDELKSGTVCGARAWLLEAEPMWAKAEHALRADPFFFVERQEPG